MKENWIELAETPFDESLIMQRDGGGGRVYTYVAAKDYIKKLNFICDYEWESRIQEVVVEGSQVSVIGSITLGNGITKSDAGGGSIGMGRDGNPVRGDFGNAIKAATSDMIKRCCRQFGIGLDLYETDDTESRVEIQTQQESATVYAPTPVAQSGFRADKEGWNPAQKQVNFLAKLKVELRRLTLE